MKRLKWFRGGLGRKKLWNQTLTYSSSNSGTNQSWNVVEHDKCQTASSGGSESGEYEEFILDYKWYSQKCPQKFLRKMQQFILEEQQLEVICGEDG